MRFATILLLMLAPYFVLAQEVGVRFDFRVTKDWKLTDRLSFDVKQNLNLRPELNSFENDPFDDALGDLFLLPGAEEERDDDEDNEGDDDDNTQSGLDPFNQPDAGNIINDEAVKFDLDIAGATQFDLDFEITDNLNISGGYALFYQPGRVRHGWTTALNYTIPLPSKKIRLKTRAALQHTGESRDDGFRIRSGSNLGLRGQYRAWKTHRPYAGIDLAGRWRRGKYNWDRYRLRAGFDFRPNESKSSIRLEYRFTKRINRDRYSHDIRFAYTLSFNN